MAAGSSTGWMNDGGLIGSGSAVPRSPSLRSMRATLKPDPKRSVSTVVSRTGCGSSPSISPSLVAWAAWSPGHTFIRTVAGKPRAIHTTTRLRSTRRRIGPASTNGRAIAAAPYPSPVEATGNYDRWVSTGPNGPLHAHRFEISLVGSACVVHPVRVATERWFLKLDGIAGESTHASHKDEIDVESWSWGVSHPGVVVRRRWRRRCRQGVVPGLPLRQPDQQGLAGAVHRLRVGLAHQGGPAHREPRRPARASTISSTSSATWS